MLAASFEPILPETTVDRVLTLFRRGAELVDAAVAALDALQLRLADASHRRADLASDMLAEVRAATIEGDNLLVRTAASQGPSTIFALGRSAGGAMRVQTIEIDRDKVALTRADGGSALDALLREEPEGDAYDAALRAFCVQVATAASCLSIAKTRLDLQASFLDSILEPTAVAPKVLNIGLDQAAIRDLALAARRQLDRQALPLAARNRRTLEALFATVGLAAARV